MPAIEKSVGFRRNGKKQACEPCRKGKLACDHGAPFCGRCVRRQTTAKCIYHPAPMTRGRGPASESISPRPFDAVRQSTESSPPLASVSSEPPLFPILSPSRGAPESFVAASELPTATGPTDPTSQASITPLPVHRKGGRPPEWKTAVYPRSTKFYGPTSFSADFLRDSTVKEDLLNIGEDERKHPGAWLYGEPLQGYDRPNAPHQREKQAMKALWNVPSKATCEMLVSPTSSTRGRILDRTFFRHAVSTLWSTYGNVLSLPRGEDPIIDWHEKEEDAPPLIAICDALFKNEELPLGRDPDDGMEWLNSFMGPNIRFELLGLLFATFGLGYLALQDWDPVFSLPENHGRDRRQAAWRMKECANVCLRMCDLSETVNYLVAALIWTTKGLETGCTGDETYQIRRLHGSMVTTTITSGLHRLPRYGSGKITAASEYKRRLFCYIYCNDKTTASLNGIPPLLTRRFCDVQLCLDLTGDIFYASPEVIADAISKLDSAGWSHDHEMGHEMAQVSTFLRARTQVHMIREEILELALGVDVEVSAESVFNLHQKSQQMFDALPPQLHYYDEQGLAKGSTGPLLFDQAYLNLMQSQNKFLIDRVAKARGIGNGQDLLNSAMEMLDLALMFWSKRDQLMSFSHGFDWIMTSYGVPSAGVICVELLKLATGQSSLEISRSGAIQKLTLLVAFLEWIRPTDGNYTLAQRLRKVVRRLLDYVLDASQKEPATEAGSEVQYDPMLDSFDGMNDMNDMDWLSTIDWTQGSWMEFD